MSRKPFFDQMFARIDAMDPEGFAASFTEDGVFRLGNTDAVKGATSIKTFITGFFNAIGGIGHDFQNCWDVEDRSFCNGTVTYERKDGSKLTVPWATISRFEGEKLAEYYAYVDASKLFAP